METRFLSLLGVLVLLLAVPSASALGEGQVLSYKPNVASTGSAVTLSIELINDGPPGVCIDEIIITPPDSWGGTADVTEYDRSAYTEYRDRTDNNKDLVGDDQSSRIVPEHSLCPGETVNIKIEGLTAPGSYEVSDIVIKTSDLTHNPGSAQVYQTIDTNIPGKVFALPKVYVTEATQLKLEYLHITGFTQTGFTGEAWGAWARLDELYLEGQSGANIDIEIMTNAGLHTIYSGSLTGGVDTLVMDYSGWVPVSMDTGDLSSGYVRDGANVQYTISYTGGPAFLVLRGESEDILNDPDWSSSGLTDAVGTIITAATVPSEFREILVQTVDDNGYDVNGEPIPLEAMTDLGIIVTPEPYMTDTDGNAYFTLSPDCDFGVANVVISTDPLATTPSVTEKVGIDAGPSTWYVITEGDGVDVPAGESQLIEVTLYDECGNKITNTNKVFVEFNYLTDDCGPINKLAQSSGGVSHQHEEEWTNMGVAQVYLKTGCELCTHEVQIILGPPIDLSEVIYLYGVPNVPYQIEVEISETEIEADDCIVADIKITDICNNTVSEIPSEVGDEMEEWESIVRVTIADALVVDQRGWASSSQTWISDSDFREEYIYNGGSNPYVQGKLNAGVGQVTICGCMGLGTFDVIAESDTIYSGRDSVSVINADPDCIEVNTIDQLLLCQTETEIDIAIKDVCGNFWRNQGCGTGEANYCVDIEIPASGSSCTEDDAHLSTNSVCIPVGFGDLGYLENPVKLFRDTEDCCQLNIEVSRGTGCCGEYPVLEQCEPVNVLFHGGPSFMTTQFFKTRVDPRTQDEQLHEPIENYGFETVSEEVLDLFTVYDNCGHVVKDFDGTIDVLKENEDCASIYQVDHPLVLEEGEREGFCMGRVPCPELTQFGEFKCVESGCTWDDPRDVCYGDIGSCAEYTKEQCLMVGDAVPKSCEWITDCNDEFEDTIIKKLVIHNCAPETCKQWLHLEVDDIMVDKLAFYIDHEVDPSLWVYVYMENENKPGYQPGDPLVGKAPMIFGGPTIIELRDSPTPYWDDQRQGGVLIRAGDSRDFYIMLVNQDPMGPLTIPCGTYSAQFLYYQDYTGPDFTEWGCGYPDPDFDGIIEIDHCGVMDVARDGCLDSDNFNWIGPGSQAPHPVCPYSGPGLMFRRDSRNDDYGHSTPDYGFGDVYMNDLPFKEGQAWTKQRDLTAETVKDWVLDVKSSGAICNYDDFELEIRNQPEVINFVAQPATQIELINHDKCEEKIVSCDENWDEEVNAYLFNIQVTDGFENPVGKELEIELEYCLKIPVSNNVERIINHWCQKNFDDFGFDNEEMCRLKYKDIDHCYTKEELKEFIKDTEFGEYMGEVLFGDYFGEEFGEWLDSYFEDAKVEFWDIAKNPLPYDAHGHQFATTDSNGQAQVYVTASKTGWYKIIARPLALDGATAFVWFNAGAPAKLDLMALPSFGVPADGEQEALLLLRALDECGNLVDDHVHGITVEVVQGEQVYISQDFDGKNNYDSDVTGTLWCNWFLGFTKLAVLSDKPQTAVLMASSGEMDSDTTEIAFQGAPVQLNITDITPSDRIPADGRTGAWVTVQVQDKNYKRVTGYLGSGYAGDPGDPWGMTDFRFERICIELDDTEAQIPLWFMELPDIEKQTFGWINFHEVMSGPGIERYCGDLLFGEGKVYVTYGNPDCNHGGTVNINVYDAQPYQGQEFDENGIPVSVHATQLDPASGHADFVDPASQWNAMSNKVIALADGESKVLIEIQVENPYMDVRQAVGGVAYVGGTAQEGAVLSWNGMVDPHNPTSARFVTDPNTGSTYLELTSTTPGTAEITITGGDAYVCLGIDDITLSACILWCDDNLPLGADCLALCLSGDIGVYNCPTCEEYIPKFWCQYSVKEDLTPKTITVEFLEVASNEIYLSTGWNFISTPYALEDPEFATLFSGLDLNAVYGWDANTQSWVLMTGTDEMEPLKGYWAKMNSEEVLVLTYAEPEFPEIPTMEVKSGWNAVGLTWDSPVAMMNALISIHSSYSQAIGWIAALQQYAIPVANTGGDGPFETGGVQMEPKQGYWIWVTSPDTLAGLTAKGGA